MNAPKNLRDLLDHALVERGVTSGRRLADVAQREGFDLTHTTVNAIRGGTYKSQPSDETLRAIAWLAGVSVEDAFTAAGLPVPGPPFADELPPGVDKLSPKARRAVIELLRVLVDEEAGEEREDSSAPMKPARESRAQTDYAWAAREGIPSAAPDTTTGEEPQDVGRADEPA